MAMSPPLNPPRPLYRRSSLLGASKGLPTLNQRPLPHKKPKANPPNEARIDLVAAEAAEVEDATDSDRVRKDRRQNLHH